MDWNTHNHTPIIKGFRGDLNGVAKDISTTIKFLCNLFNRHENIGGHTMF